MTDSNQTTQALEQLRSIRKTIDTTTGARYFIDLTYSLWPLMLLSGMVVLGGCGGQWLLRRAIDDCQRYAWAVGILWGTLVLALGVVKVVLMIRKSRSEGLSLLGYSNRVAKGIFLDIDLPLELVGLVLVLFFVKIGQLQALLGLLTVLYGGMLAIAGKLFHEQGITRFGYLSVGAGGLSLLFFVNNPLEFAAAFYGIGFIVTALLMRRRFRVLQGRITQAK
jgi:hypothetical protein